MVRAFLFRPGSGIRTHATGSDPLQKTSLCYTWQAKINKSPGHPPGLFYAYPSGNRTYTA